MKPTSPLSAKLLAEKMDVRVWYPAQIPGISARVLKLLEECEEGAWSAATLVRPDKRLVILNSKHNAGRQSNDLMHELSHLICGHDPSQSQVLDGGLMMVTEYDAAQEEEADLLAATMLLPRVALVWIMEESMKLAEAAEHFGVSTELLQMRINRAGVAKQFGRRNQLSR